MTVKELKNCFSRFNIKTKISVPDDREITNEDIEQGKIFQRFILGDNLLKTIDGLGIEDGKVCYFYTSLEKIEVETDEFFPPCGGKQEVSVYAFYSIRKHFANGWDSELISGEKSKVNSIVKIDNPLFAYEKPYIINDKPNDSDINNEVNVSATYYFKGKKYTASKHVIQHINTYSSWLVEEEPTESIFITLSENDISNKGGVVYAKVERLFSRIYYKKDSCGNKVAGKSEPGLIEDITNKCLITSSNKKAFIANKNSITVLKQEVGAKARESKITARYLDNTDVITLRHKEGGVSTYKYELSFADGTKNKFVELETSLPSETDIDIVSKEHKYIDNVYVSTKNSSDVKIESDSEWVYGIKYENDNSVFIKIKTIDINVDKDNDREATLTVTSEKDGSLHITIVVSQPSLSVIKEEYKCDFNSEGIYTVNEIDSSDIYFHPYKILTYENGDTEYTEIDDNISVKYVSASSNEKLFNVNSVYKNGENYHFNFNNLASHSINDIDLLVIIGLYDGKNKLFESNKYKITIKAELIVDYNYELCFDGHNKFQELVWHGSKEEKFINVNSLKHKLINGKYSGNELTPFKIGIYDENGKEYFDNTFSVKALEDKIQVFPIKTNKNISKTYTITQKETGNKINFKLSYSNKEKLKVNLKVLVYSDVIGKDIWTGNDGYMLIDGNEKIKLVPCWLYPNIKDNIDTAYNGTIEIDTGIHRFETFNVVCLEYGTKTHRDCNIKEEINVDEATKNITLKIKV